MCSLERKNGRWRNWMTVLTVALGAVVVGLFSGENASAIGNQGNCRTSHAGYWAPICKYEAACADHGRRYRTQRTGDPITFIATSTAPTATVASSTTINGTRSVFRRGLARILHQGFGDVLWGVM